MAFITLFQNLIITEIYKVVFTVWCPCLSLTLVLTIHKNCSVLSRSRYKGGGGGGTKNEKFIQLPFAVTFYFYQFIQWGVGKGG